MNTLELFGVYSADANMNGVSGSKGIKVNVTIGNEIVSMQFDTGATVSILPESTYRRVLYKHQASPSSDLIPIDGKFQSYTESNTSHCQLLLPAVSDQHYSGEIGYNRSSWTGRVSLV